MKCFLQLTDKCSQSHLGGDESQAENTTENESMAAMATAATATILVTCTNCEVLKLRYACKNKIYVSKMSS